MSAQSQPSVCSKGAERALRPVVGQPLWGRRNLLQCWINIFGVNCIGVKNNICREEVAGWSERGALQGQGASRAGGVSVLGTTQTKSWTRDMPMAVVSGDMKGEVGRRPQPWLGVEEQPEWAPSRAGDLLQLGWGFSLPWAAQLFLAASIGVYIPWLLSASRPCSLYPPLSVFICLSVWSQTNYPPCLRLRGLLLLHHVCSSCASVPFSLQFSNHICNGYKCKLTLGFIWRDQSSVDNNSSWPPLASELHLLKWEVGCVGFFLEGVVCLVLFVFGLGFF